jgi:YggT family protein
LIQQGGGGVEGNRTPDLLIANEALYQLSYNPALQGADNAQACTAKSSTRGTSCAPGRAPLGSGARGATRLLTILYQLIQTVLNLYWWAVILAAVMSNLIAFGVLDTRNRLVWTVTDFLYRITEPALRRIRTFLPSFGGLDLSPLVLLLVIWVARAVVERIYTAIVFGGLQPLFY